MQKVYIIQRNADFTEGRGPMLYDRTFNSLELAEEFIMSKKGIMGTPQKYSPSYSYPSIYREYNGYRIIIAEVLDSLISQEELELLKLEKQELEQRIAEINAKIKD